SVTVISALQTWSVVPKLGARTREPKISTTITAAPPINTAERNNHVCAPVSPRSAASSRDFGVTSPTCHCPDFPDCPACLAGLTFTVDCTEQLPPKDFCSPLHIKNKNMKSLGLRSCVAGH